MTVEIIVENKEKYMDLLLLADEQENMIKKGYVPFNCGI